MAASGSQKLKELAQAMEKQDHDLQERLGPESKSAGDHVISMKGVGTFRVADGHDSAEEQRRLLARRALAEEGDQGARVSMRSIYLMAALAAGLAIFLLWLLFGGRSHGSSQESAAPPFLTASELYKAQGDDACPDWRWIPEACLGSAASISQSAYNTCKEFTVSSGYTPEKLQSCGLN